MGGSRKSVNCPRAVVPRSACALRRQVDELGTSSGREEARPRRRSGRSDPKLCQTRWRSEEAQEAPSVAASRSKRSLCRRPCAKTVRRCASALLSVPRSDRSGARGSIRLRAVEGPCPARGRGGTERGHSCQRGTALGPLARALRKRRDRRDATPRGPPTQRFAWSCLPCRRPGDSWRTTAMFRLRWLGGPGS